MASLVSQTQIQQPQPQHQLKKSPLISAKEICDNAKKDETFLLIPVRELSPPQSPGQKWHVTGFNFSDDFYKMIFFRRIQCQNDRRRRETPEDSFSIKIAKLCKYADKEEGINFKKELTSYVFHDSIYKKQDCKTKLETTPAILGKIFGVFHSFNRYLIAKYSITDEEQLIRVIKEIMTNGLTAFVVTSERRTKEGWNLLQVQGMQFMERIKNINSQCGVAGGLSSAAVRRAGQERTSMHARGAYKPVMEQSGDTTSDDDEDMHGEDGQGDGGAGGKMYAVAKDASTTEGEAKATPFTKIQKDAIKAWWGNIQNNEREKQILIAGAMPGGNLKDAILTTSNMTKPPPPEEVNYLRNLIRESLRLSGGKRKKKTKKKKRRKKNSKKKGGRRKKSKKNRRKKKKSRRKRR